MKANFIIKSILLLVSFFTCYSTSFAQVGPIPIGTLPKNKTVKIVYDATINTGLPQGTTQVSHQGTVSGSNFSSVSTNTVVTPLDVPPYVVSITRKIPLTADVINNTEVTYLVTFSETVSNVDIGDFELTKTGSADGTIASVSAATGTAIDVIVNDIIGDGTLRLDLKASGTGIVDDGGTAITGGFTGGEVYTFDHSIPVLNPVTIASNNANPAYAKEGDIVTLSFTASEDVGIPTITLATHNVVPVAGAANSYTATWTMTAADAEGLIAFSISFSDLAGNAGVAVTNTTDGSAVTYDRTPPAVTINQAAAQSDPTSSTTVNFTVVFSEAVDGFATGNVSFTGSTVGGTLTGTVTEIAPNDGTTFNVAVTGMTTPDGAVVASLAAGVASDLAGNLNIASTTTDNSVNWISDQPPVVVSINRQSPLAELTNAPSVTFRVTFSEDVTGVDAADFTVTTTGTATGSVNTVTPVNEHTYDVTISGVTGDGTLQLDLESSGTGIKDKDGVTFDDIAGGFTTGQTYTIDKTVPTVTINQAAAQSDPTNASPVLFTVVFSEAVSGFATGDVTLSGTAGATSATVSEIAPMDGTTFQVSVNGMSSSGTVIASVGAGKANDLAGNNNTASSSTDNTVTYDVTAPTVTINQTASQPDPTNTSPISFTVVFSESVSGFTGTDVSFAGSTAPGTLLANVSGSGANYTVTVSGMTGSGTVVASIAAGGATDVAGNGNAVSTSTDNTVTYDVTQPTVTINQAVSQPDPTNNSLLNFTVQFNEPVTGFTSSDVSFTGSTVTGNLVATVTGSGALYNVQVSGMTGDGLIIVSVPAGSAQDAAGNFNTASTSTDNSLTYDITLPTATIEQAIGQADPTNATPINFTVTFTEPVVGFNATRFNITGTAIPSTRTLTQVNGLTYTLGLSGFSGSGTVTVSLPAGGGISDLAGNGFRASTSVDNTVTYDVTAPTVQSINRFNAAPQGTASTTLKFTVTFDEAVTGVDVTDFTLTNVNGNAGTTNITNVAPVSGAVYDVTVTVSLINGAEVRLDLKSTGTGIMDVAGNSIQTGFTAGQTYILGIPPAFTNCPTTPMQFDADAGQCYATLSKSTLISGLNVTGAPTPTLTVWIGATEITGSYNFPVGNTEVTVIASNGIGDPATCSFTVTVVDNQAPTVSPVTANPAALWPPNHKMKDVQLSYSISDNCGCTPSISITSNQPVDGTGDGDTSPDWEVVNGSVTSTGAMIRLRAERANKSDGRVYTITVSCTDHSGNTNSQQTTVTVAHNITGPITGTSFKVGSTVAFSGVFWDKPGNKHTANWLLDGSTSVKGSVTEPSGAKNGKVTGSYRFTSAGIYKLQMNVVDQTKVTSYSNMNEDMEAIVVIYDPKGGYTYGGGYFASPAGALKANPTATGKANFGFTVNYYKNATLPKGETQFEFKVGEFEFNAVNMEYLSVSGYKAVVRGAGKITGGQSGIQFMLYVIDGALDRTGVDKIRLKIFNKNTGEVYYDSEPGQSDAANPTTTVGAGSTVVIGGTAVAPLMKVEESYLVEETKEPKLLLTALPNPTTTHFTLQLRGGSDEPVNLRVVDGVGRTIEARSKIATNNTIQIGAAYRPGIYFVEAVQGKERVTLKLLKQPD